MIEQDTIRLLRECDAGVQMGVSAIDEVLQFVRSDDMRTRLSACKREHEELGTQIRQSLDRYGDEGKEPNPIAKGMSWLKTNAELRIKPSDSTAAALVTDGCNMGVKSLNQYLNEYEAADEHSKDVAKRLIHLEEKLTADMLGYL